METKQRSETKKLKPLVLNKETLKSFVGGYMFGTFSSECSGGACTNGCPNTFDTTTSCGNCTTSCNPTS